MNQPPPGSSPPDWIQLWNQLVRQRESLRRPEPLPDSDDRWRARANAYDERAQIRWDRPDSSRDFLSTLLRSRPGATLLDMGAGSGKWTIPLAPLVRHVTAVEPSSAMRTHLHRHLARRAIANVSVVPTPWPCPVPAPDVVLCAHAMYGFDDFVAFIHGLQSVARHTCVLLMRAPPLNGIMADDAHHLWGHPYDSANFQLAFNALQQMGIFTNVRMEAPHSWDPWTHDSVPAALTEMKRHFRLYDDSTHDAFLLNLLERRLIRRNGRVVWPDGTHGALLHWQVPALCNTRKGRIQTNPR